MENKENLVSVLQELRIDSTEKSKRGLPFISASIIIWGAILCVYLSPLPILTKNLLTFCSSLPLVPMVLNSPAMALSNSFHISSPH